MPSKEYIEKSENLIKVIDIALSCLKTEPLTNQYKRYKKDILEVDVMFQNLTSLEYKTIEVFSYFNEESGSEVHLFWQKIKEASLPYQRRTHRIEKILKRRKIRNQQDYQYAVDTMVAFLNEDFISTADYEKLSQMVKQFEEQLDKGI